MEQGEPGLPDARLSRKHADKIHHFREKIQVAEKHEEDSCLKDELMALFATYTGKGWIVPVSSPSPPPDAQLLFARSMSNPDDSGQVSFNARVQIHQVCKLPVQGFEPLLSGRWQKIQGGAWC